jgi:hypothetical protein
MGGEMNLTYLFAELLRRPGRTLSASLSVALGVALFVSLQAYASGYREAARARRALQSPQKYSLVANSVKSQIVIEPTIIIEKEPVPC